MQVIILEVSHNHKIVLMVLKIVLMDLKNFSGLTDL